MQAAGMNVNPMATFPPFPEVPKYANAYVPFQQQITCLYSPMEALKKGTIFPELYRPYGADPEYMWDQ